jgi:hypothetical protein
VSISNHATCGKWVKHWGSPQRRGFGAPPHQHRLSNMRPAVSEPGPRRPIAACAQRSISQSFCGAGRGRLTTGNHTALEGSYSNSASPSSRRHRELCVSKCTRGSSSNAAACSSAGAPGAARGSAVGTVADIKLPKSVCRGVERAGVFGTAWRHHTAAATCCCGAAGTAGTPE